jgi:glycosyltransferase involved in cell wall biosynthesis
MHLMRNGVSIIIPTCNGGRVFSECLTAIKRQQGVDALQLIVIDSGSTDETVELAESAGALVKRIPRKHFHHARTRNEAVLHASFERIVFMVQDAVPCSDKWLLEMVRALTKPGVAAAFASQIPHLDATPYARFETESIANARLNATELGNIHSIEAFQKMPYDNAYRRIALDNVCAIYRKEVLEKTPFPDVEFAEDLAWALKISFLGHRITYLPHIQVRHSHDRSPDYGFRRQIVNSYWVARIMGRVREDVSSLSLRDLAFLTGSVRAFVLQKIKEKWEGIEGFQSEDLFIDHLLKQYPLMSRIKVRWLDPIFSKYPDAPSGDVQGIAKRLNADIAYQLELIEEGYPPRDRTEWFQVLEQVVANILGRIHGEVYASCMVKGSVQRRLENFIKPFLSGV